MIIDFIASVILVTAYYMNARLQEVSAYMCWVCIAMQLECEGRY